MPTAKSTSFRSDRLILPYVVVAVVVAFTLNDPLYPTSSGTPSVRLDSFSY